MTVHGSNVRGKVYNDKVYLSQKHPVFEFLFLLCVHTEVNLNIWNRTEGKHVFVGYIHKTKNGGMLKQNSIILDSPADLVDCKFCQGEI